MKIRQIFILLTLILFSCSENKYEKLFEFSKTDNYIELSKLLNNNDLNLDTIFATGYTPLGYAVLNQNIEMVNFLIEKGANVNYYGTNYLSPFYLALNSNLNINSLKNEEYNLTDDATFNEVMAEGIIKGKKEEIIEIIAKNGLIVDKNNDDGKLFVELMREIDDYDLRKLTFTTTIEDTLILKQRKLDSIYWADKYQQDLIEHQQSQNIPIVSDPQILKEDNSITFKLHDVELATGLLTEYKYEYVVKERNLWNMEYCNSQDYRLVISHIHPFVRAVQLAYNEHRPLTISPDVIWLLICQGFSKHIELNSLKYKNKIVDFDEIKKIDVVREDFIKGETDSLWGEIIQEFSMKVKQNIIDTTLHSTIIHNFSTTTEKELIAFEIAFLEINKHYFEYNFWACGIPQITLKGKTEDWIWIRENIEKFRDFELDWWIDKLIPILDEFIETSNGNVDLEFWSKIYRYDENCGPAISGWFAKFFPYIRNGMTKLEKNPLVLNEPEYIEFFVKNGIENENFVSGLSYVDFNFHYDLIASCTMTFVSGFVGIKQNHETKSLKPEINWLILKK